MYSKRSDIHQTGVLLEKLPIYNSVSRRPVVLNDFVSQLKAKTLTAAEALKHDFISANL